MKVKKVTNNIKELRFKNDNMTQQSLADLVGCSRQTIHVLENNRYSPSFLLIKKIAKVFNVNVEEVIQIELE